MTETSVETDPSNVTEAPYATYTPTVPFGEGDGALLAGVLRYNDGCLTVEAEDVLSGAARPSASLPTTVFQRPVPMSQASSS